jgi:hypothetical protein
MSKDQAVSAIPEFSLSDLEAADTSVMTVEVNGKLTNWTWTFAGPGHPQTVAQSNRMARDRLHQDRQLEQQRLNGKKVKLPEETVDEVRERNVRSVVERIVDWSPVKINGELYPFTTDNAYKLLIDRSRIGLLTQATEFLFADDSFKQRSVPNS